MATRNKRMALVRARLALCSVLVATTNTVAFARSSHRAQAGLDLDGITGSRIIHHVTDQGIVDVAVDVSSPSFGAWVGDSGGFTFYPGTGNPDGTFSIPGVTAESYYLKMESTVYGSIYVVSSQPTIDLGEYAQGRPDAPAAGAGTVLRVSLRNMSPWNRAADDVQLVSSNAGVRISGIAYSDIEHHFPEPGDTTLDIQMDYEAENLIDASRGDQATIFQLVTRPGPAGTFYGSLSKAFTTSDLTIVDQESTLLFASLTDVPTDLVWTRTIDYPSLHAFRSAVHPAATLGGDTLFIDVLPAGSGYGPFGLGNLVAMAYSIVSSPETFSFSYGNPFPWTQTFSGVYSLFAVRYQLPGTSSGTTIYSAMQAADDSDNFPEPFNARISPPRNFQINGQPAAEDLSNVSLTPSLTWDAPGLGTANYYMVWVRELFVDGSSTRSRLLALMSTTHNELVVPPGILQPGGSYIFRVAANDSPGVNIEAAPFLFAFPISIAPTISGIATP